MGRGSYTASDWANLKRAKSLTNKYDAKAIFAAKTTHSAYDAAQISIRESRDSDDSPKSTPIIIGFDVTGSMGYLAKELAINSVNNTVTALLKQKNISNPHIMCSAIGDCKSDVSPLQATQFEADIRIVQQLLDLYLEGGGGGNNAESYNLLWYFAAFHTSHDCFEKRGKKGFLFTIGDDKCHGDLSPAEIKRVFGDTVPYTFSNRELLGEVSKKYHVIHIHLERDSVSDAEIFADWLNLLPGCATRISAKDITHLSVLINAIVSVLSGVSANEALKVEDQFVAEKIAPSLAMIKLQKENKKVITF